MSGRPQVSAVLLTMGDRPDELARAVQSVRRQLGVDSEVVVVWNGTEPDPASPADHDVHAATNLGVPAGRNLGARRAKAPVILFLDDDAELVGSDLLSSACAILDARDRVTVVGLRIVDDDDETAARHVPRLGGRRADHSGPVTAFLGGACLVRTSRFDAVGGYADDFFYSMEETELSLRLLDDSQDIWYAADLRVRHPRTEPSRHPDAVRRTAENRMRIAHRRLPALLAVAYLTIWATITTIRRPHDLGTLIRGYRDGRQSRRGERVPISWATAWRMGRLGRPPVI